MPVNLRPLQTRSVTSFVSPTGEVRQLRDPLALASPRQLWRLNQEGLLALVQRRPRSISKAHAAGAIDYAERQRRRHVARLERLIAKVNVELEECERDIQAHDAAIAFIEFGSWQEAARVSGFRDGSSARQAVELRTDYLDVEGARLASNRQHRVGRLAWLPGAQERRRAGVKP
ncbi:MAG: hypothetical protein ACR2M2_04365 [Gaiellaceae bacterium]